MKRSNMLKISLLFVVLTLIFVACSKDKNKNAQTETQGNQQETGKEELAYDPPSLEDLDEDDPMTEMIQYGEKVFNETNTVLAEEVGNELSCQSCHADGGKDKVSSMVGVTTQFPQYRPREDAVFTIQDRINGCMLRSMNGDKIDHKSKEMRAIVSYLSYISEGIETGEDIPWRMQNTMEEIPEPNVANGEALYEEKNCMTCHATDGSGIDPNTGPALWGENSFNDGAGMGRMSKMAGFIQNNMPPGGEDPLTDQEAADLAAFILSKERPEWEGHDDDWPKGDKPTDIITKERKDKIKEGTFDWTEIEAIVPSEE